MKDGADARGPDGPAGEALVRALAALASPHRIRIVAALHGRRVHVSGLAREVGLSRPLTHMHLRRLEDAGLVTGALELSDEGKAMRYYEVAPFALRLTPATVAEAARGLDAGDAAAPEIGGGR